MSLELESSTEETSRIDFNVWSAASPTIMEGEMRSDPTTTSTNTDTETNTGAWIMRAWIVHVRWTQNGSHRKTRMKNRAQTLTWSWYMYIFSVIRRPNTYLFLNRRQWQCHQKRGKNPSYYTCLFPSAPCPYFFSPPCFSTYSYWCSRRYYTKYCVLSEDMVMIVTFYIHFWIQICIFTRIQRQSTTHLFNAWCCYHFYQFYWIICSRGFPLGLDCIFSVPRHVLFFSRRWWPPRS